MRYYNALRSRSLNVIMHDSLYSHEVTGIPYLSYDMYRIAIDSGYLPLLCRPLIQRLVHQQWVLESWLLCHLSLYHGPAHHAPCCHAHHQSHHWGKTNKN